MNGPRDKLGKEIELRDFVRIEVGEMIGEVVDIKTGGVMVGQQIMPAVVTVQCQLLVDGPPQGCMHQLLLLKRMAKKIATPNEA